VLDLGCGYGGRTIGYATLYQAARVVGVEVYPHVVERCQEFADSLSAHNVKFLLSTQDRLPVDDGTFDIVVSYDVMEHVEDPAKMLSEVYRALRPGGRFLLVFTPYWGALSHHLGFVTKIPGVHWFFDARTLVDAANRFLLTEAGKRLGTKPIGTARQSFDNRRLCPPGINGMTTREFLSLLENEDFEVAELHATPLLARYRVLGTVGAFINRLISRSFGTLGEALSFNLVCVLDKPSSNSERALTAECQGVPKVSSTLR
jgi:SAM-dependent methyltransferase